ncbi:MAG: gamma-glutamylcyclotransferase [Vannielia sp.]|uniref:gamma-glutamylcyclotransferase n=1 Tax=Vannielia sp. TaxID=2813045 RepID=UPI003B8B8843
MLQSRGLPTGWWYSDAEREADRAATLARRPTQDLWVFAYGSLMWDPAFHFSEVRRAHAPGHARRFILLDTRGGRGTAETPGLMAALDTCPEGPGCDGLAFRIPAAQVEAESAILWQRERVADGYLSRFIDTTHAGGTVPALTFLADHSSATMVPTLSRETQIEYIATGTGILGTSADYLRTIARQFAELRIADPDITALLARVEARIAAASATPT